MINEDDCTHSSAYPDTSLSEFLTGANIFQSSIWTASILNHPLPKRLFKDDWKRFGALPNWPTHLDSGLHENLPLHTLLADQLEPKPTSWPPHFSGFSELLQITKYLQAQLCLPTEIWVCKRSEFSCYCKKAASKGNCLWLMLEITRVYNGAKSGVLTTSWCSKS